MGSGVASQNGPPPEAKQAECGDAVSWGGAVSALPRHPTSYGVSRSVIWEELHCHPSRQRITTPRRTHWLQWDAPHLPPP